MVAAPAAPSRPHRLPTTTPTARRQQLEDQTNQLADDLGSSLRISKRSTPQVALSSSLRRVPNASKAAATAPTSRAGVKSASRPAAADAAPVSALSPAERAKEAMRIVNTSLQSLSNLNKSGWRASTNSAAGSTSSSSSRPASAIQRRTSSSSLASDATARANPERVEKEVRACGAALAELRKMIRESIIPHRPTEIEKAAGSLVANLVDMELYALALPQLALMRASIITWWSPSSPLTSPLVSPPKPGSAPRSLAEYASIASIPLPPPAFFAPPSLNEAVGVLSARPAIHEVVPLVLASQQYTLGCLFRADMSIAAQKQRLEGLADAFAKEGSPLDWRDLLDRNGDVDASTQDAILRRVDAMMTSMFGTVTKGCVGADALARPSVFLTLRSRALLFYGTTRALSSGQDKLGSFVDQARKVLLLYGRQAEMQNISDTEINECVKRAFEEVYDVLQRRKVKLEGKAWTTMCEVVLHIAKRADDLLMVERASLLLTGTAGAGETSEAQVAQVTAKAISSLAVLESFFNTGQDNGVCDHVRRLNSILPVLTRLRSSSFGQNANQKIDKIVERLRYVTIRRAKGSNRLDQLMTAAGSEKRALSEVDGLLLSLLDVVVCHVESWLAATDVAEVSHCQPAESSVEALLVLAYSHLVVDDRQSYGTTFAYLDRALPLVGRLSRTGEIVKLDLRAHHSIRSLASALYNIGGTLYNESKPESALRFVQRSCDLTKAATQSLDGHDDLAAAMDRLTVKEGKLNDSAEEASARQEAVRDMTRHLSKRYELLALCHQAVGDKKPAHEAYVNAVVATTQEDAALLEKDTASLPVIECVGRHPVLNRLVQRATKMATFDLLQLGPQASLKSAVEVVHSPSFAAAIIELQMASLEPSLDKPEAQTVMRAMIEDLLMLYGSQRTPIRRARILVRRMQQRCSSSNKDLSAAADATEIEQLCSAKALADDAGLERFARQYLAFSHVWLAFNAQQAQQTDSSETLVAEARQALLILRASLDTDLPASPSAVHNVKSPLERQKMMVPPLPSATATGRKRVLKAADTSSKASAYKTPRSRKILPSARSARPGPVTPPSQSLLETQTATTSRVNSSALKPLHLDNAEACYRTLDTLAHLLGALGYPILKIQYLRFMRRLSSQLEARGASAFVATSTSIAHEYLRIGKSARAGLVLAQATARLEGSGSDSETVTPQVRTAFWSVQAEYFARLGNHDRSAEIYEAASSLADSIELDASSVSTAARILERTALLQRGALAAGVCSVILQRRGEMNRSVEPALQAMRLWTRALANASRLSAQTASTTDDDSTTFADARTDPNAALSDHPKAPKRRTAMPSSGLNAALSWQLAEHFGSSILRVAELYALRGTAKSAEHYAQAALDFSRDINSRRLMVRALVLRASVRLQATNSEGAELDLQLIEDVVDPLPSIESVGAACVLADFYLRQGANAEAMQACEKARLIFDQIRLEAADGDTNASPTKASAHVLSPVAHRSATKLRSPSATSPSSSPSATSVASDSILSSTLARILRIQVRLLRQQLGTDHSQTALRRLSALAGSEEDKAEESTLLASIRLADLLKHFASDPVLGLLPESVLTIPTLTSLITSSARVSTPRSAPSLLNSLLEVDRLLTRALSMSASRSGPARLRELAALFSVLRGLQASVGKPSKRAAVEVAHTLDLGLAVTLRRDMLEAIDYKLAPGARQDDLLWPRIDVSCSHKAAEQATTKYWAGLRDRYKTEAHEPSLTELALASVLPAAWTTVSIHLSLEEDCLVLVRHRRAAQALILRVPLDRQARREGEEESYTFELARDELQDIVAASNLGAQSAKHVDGKAARATWWAERKELDSRLRVMLQTIENEWLGCFKSVFQDGRTLPIDAMSNFKTRIERTLRRMMVRNASDKKTSRLKLDESILECVAALSPKSRDEDFEDLYHFMSESFQFSGVPVACDETDVDQVVVDLKNAFEELHASRHATPSEDDHLFLILDKTLQAFPWESLPCLRNRSISRLPSLSFLRDRLDLMATIDAFSTDPHAFHANPASTGYILNPGGDLQNTQKMFEPWLNDMSSSMGWTGIVARAPSDEEVRIALSTKEVVLYFGHGGAEQYIRSQTLRHLPRCAVTMLWGCSSGLLKDQGDFEPVGTPNHYMIAGCPALVANLWDVTDKDIDKFAENVFRLTGLTDAGAASLGTGTDTPLPTTLTAAVARSRDVPLLKYLNGAAPVVYGIPVRFTRGLDAKIAEQL